MSAFRRRPETMSQSAGTVLAALRRQPGDVTARELSDRCGLTVAQVRRALGDLRTAGLASSAYDARVHLQTTYWRAERSVA